MPPTNSAGEKIQNLVNDEKVSGIYKVEFNGSNFASGIYFYSLSLNGKIMITSKMMLIK